LPELRQYRHRPRMANTYSQIYLHVIFAVEGRQNLIRAEDNDELQKYITGIVCAQKQKLIAINNMPDHVHILLGLQPDMALSDLVGGHQIRIVCVHQAQALGGRPVLLAGGIRRVFLLALATRHRPPLHPEPAEAPCEENVPRGIHPVVGEVRSRVRQTIYFQDDR